MAANFLRETFLVCKANPTGRKLKDLHLTEALKTIILNLMLVMNLILISLKHTILTLISINLFIKPLKMKNWIMRLSVISCMEV